MRDGDFESGPPPADIVVRPPYFPSRERDREELGLLPTLITVAELGTFAAAARALRLTRASVFRRVRRLQAIVGYPLYRTRRRRIELTAAGQEIVGYAQQIASLQRRRLHPRGRSRAVLACTATMLRHVLGPALEAFTARGAGELEVLTVSEDEAIAAVREERADLAVTRQRVLGQPCTRLLRSRPQVAARVGDRVFERPVRLELLSSVRVIASPEVRLAHDPIEHVASVDAALALAAAGLGIAVIDGFHRALPVLRTATLRDAPFTTLWVTHTRTLPRERAPEALRRAIFDTVRGGGNK